MDVQVFKRIFSGHASVEQLQWMMITTWSAVHKSDEGPLPGQRPATETLRRRRGLV